LGVYGTDLAIAIKFKPDYEPTWQVMAQLPTFARQSYCSDSNVYWIIARRINSRLAFIVQKADDTVLYKQLITPKDCPAWPFSQR
jgi:hypothetical protein